jgi:hypothetical protein
MGLTRVSRVRIFVPKGKRNGECILPVDFYSKALLSSREVKSPIMWVHCLLNVPFFLITGCEAVRFCQKDKTRCVYFFTYYDLLKVDVNI